MRLANPLSDLAIGELFETLLPDFVLAFAFFTALAYAVLGKRFERQRPAIVMSATIGLSLSVEHTHRMRQLYQGNGIAAVIVQPEDLQGFRGPDNLLQRIEQAAKQYESLMRYPATSEAQPSLDRYSP